MDWGFSSSSDSGSDDDRPVSTLRTDTQFYQHFQNDEYGADWPADSRLVNSSQNHVDTNNFNGTRTNEIENESSANASQLSGLSGSRVLSMADLEETPNDIVLLNEGGKYRPIRVITTSAILPPRKTPDKIKVHSDRRFVEKEFI